MGQLKTPFASEETHNKPICPAYADDCGTADSQNAYAETLKILNIKRELTPQFPWKLAGLSLFSRCYGMPVDFVVPSASSNVDGNTYSFGGPAINQPSTLRYQQVYGASELAYLSNFGGGWLFDVVFRGDATNGTQTAPELPSMQLNVSTTQRGPAQLSSVFPA